MPQLASLPLTPVFLVLLLTTALSPASGATLIEGWVSFDGTTQEPSPPRVELISQSTTGVVLRVTTPGAVCEKVEVDGSDYFRLSLPEYFHTLVEGAAELPAIRQLLAVPQGCEVSVNVAASDTIRFADCVVYPVEQVVTRYTDEGWSYLDTEFMRDQQAYSRGGSYPAEAVDVDSVGNFRGQGVLPVTVYPVRFDAQVEQVYVCPDILVTIELTGGTGSFSDDVGPFSGIAERLLLGYAGQGHVALRGAGEPGDHWVASTVEDCAGADYLMVVEGSLMGNPSLGTLAQHRATYNGFNVAIVSDTTVIAECGDPGISDNAIRCFVSELYEDANAEHMPDGRLGYALLVGNASESAQTSLIPAHEQDGSTTDHWYACIDPPGEVDWFPDLMIGRLCASDTTELRREVQKFVGYEADADSSEAWRSHILLTSAFCGEDSSTGESVRSVYDTVRTLITSVEHDISEIHALDWEGYPPGAQRDSVCVATCRAINDTTQGVFAWETCSHGGVDMCQAFRWADVESLRNVGGQLPFTMNYACHTGAYDLYNSVYQTDDCLGEALMHAHEIAGEPTGALAYFGASEASLPAWDDIGMYVWEGLFDAGEHQIGGFIAYAKMKYLARTGLNAKALQFNLLGDPAIDIMLTNTGGSGYASAPDFVVTADSLWISSSYPTGGDNVTLAARVENRSNYDPDDPVSVSLEVWERDGSACVFAETVSVSMTEWSAAVADTVWQTSVDSLGHWLLRAKADPGSLVTELSEGNNDAELPFGLGFERSGFPVQLGGDQGLSVMVADVDGTLPREVVASVQMPGAVMIYSAHG